MCSFLQKLLLICLVGVVLHEAPVLTAQDSALVAVGESWSYLRGFAEPSAEPGEWTRDGFDDVAWSKGESGFGFGFASYPEATIIQNELGAVFNSVYLRRVFSWDLGTNLCWLTLRVDYDGGYVAYLNGTEVARRNLPGLPGAPIPFTQTGSYRTNSGAEMIDLTPFAALLRPARNVLAFQWHLPGPASSSMRFVPELRANFVRGPYLQNVTSTSAHVVWRTPFPVETRLQYRQEGQPLVEFLDAAPKLFHDVPLTHLQPGTAYSYAALCSTGQVVATSPWTVFRTFAESGPITFVVTGDMGGGSPSQYALARVMDQTNPDLVVFLGDLVYPYYLEAKQDLRFFSVYHRLMQRVPTFSIVGNHESMYGGLPVYYSDFVLPTNDVPADVLAREGTSPESYYSFDAGEAHFSCLYVSLQYSHLALKADAPQMAWLEKDLAQSQKPWKFLLLHHPLRNSGGHRYADYNYDSTLDSVDVARLLVPLIRRHGVQMVFTAHDHNFERFKPVHGANFIVSGGGGGPLYGMSWLGPDPASATFLSAHHVTRVNVTRDELRLSAISPLGKVLDSMVYRRTPPPDVEVPVNWSTPTWVQSEPTAELPPPSQEPDQAMSDPPVPAVAGEVSNLGGLRVTYDYGSLYLEFSSVMIYGDATVAVFLQGQQAPGVTNLSGLGNGLVDPDGEGVDGLDWLENLEFEGFRPTVGLLLGDAQADGPIRSSARTNLAGMNSVEYPAPGTALALGQGAFLLADHFPDLPGGWIQQLAQIPGGTDASTIRVALPMDALGLEEGSRVNVGGVVVRSLGTNSPVSRAVWLDRGYLGSKLAGGGFEPSKLSPVSLRLVPPLDRDEDGYPDVIEVQMGTDPLDPASGFQVTLDTLPDTSIRLTWNTVPGRRYVVEATESLAKPFEFTPITPASAPVRSTRSMAALPNPDRAARFYRVRVVK